MDGQSTQDRVRAAIVRALGLTSPAPNFPLRMGSTPGWDSLGHMTVVMELEREFGVRVPVTRISDLVDVDAIVRAIAAGMK